MNRIETLQNDLKRAKDELSYAEARVKAIEEKISLELARELTIKEARKTVIKLDKQLWKHFYPDWKTNSDTAQITEDNCFMYFEADIKCIYRDHDIGEAKAYILEQIKRQSGNAKIEEYILSHLHMDKCIDDAVIRKDFAAALRSVKRGDDLSGRLDWGFSPKDISELAKLHKAGKFRKKIENLLTDCNFHSEYSMMTAKQYDELIH